MSGRRKLRINVGEREYVYASIQPGWKTKGGTYTDRNRPLQAISISGEPYSVDLKLKNGVVYAYFTVENSYHGGILNSLIRYRNKKLAEFQQMLSRCKKGSRRYRKLLKAKKRMLRRIRHQVKDILHKITSNFLKMCLQKGIRTIVIGDITNIRERVEGNDNFNQKIHQWCFRKMVEMITYKAQLLGIEVELVPEEYTSQVCPVCGRKNHPVGRNYECSKCGFRYHRDGVGAINIWQRYLGRESQVVAGLAPVRGVRFKPHLCGYGVSNAPWKAA